MKNYAVNLRVYYSISFRRAQIMAKSTVLDGHNHNHT